MAEGELIAACEAAQIMLFAMQLRVDCKGALNLTWLECKQIDETCVSSCLFSA